MAAIWMTGSERNRNSAAARRRNRFHHGGTEHPEKKEGHLLQYYRLR